MDAHLVELTRGGIGPGLEVRRALVPQRAKQVHLLLLRLRCVLRMEIFARIWQGLKPGESESQVKARLKITELF